MHTFGFSILNVVLSVFVVGLAMEKDVPQIALVLFSALTMVSAFLVGLGVWFRNGDADE